MLPQSAVHHEKIIDYNMKITEINAGMTDNFIKAHVGIYCFL